jgi:hypothetical protein
MREVNIAVEVEGPALVHDVEGVEVLPVPGKTEGLALALDVEGLLSAKVEEPRANSPG